MTWNDLCVRVTVKKRGLTLRVHVKPQKYCHTVTVTNTTWKLKTKHLFTFKQKIQKANGQKANN